MQYGPYQPLWEPCGEEVSLCEHRRRVCQTPQTPFLCTPCAEIEHGHFYEIDYIATELYTKRFAFFFVRSWIRGLQLPGKSPD